MNKIPQSIKIGQKAFIFGAATIFLLLSSFVILGVFPSNHQRPVNHVFGVGIDLTPAYGTIAISFPSGQILSAALIEGDSTYREMMFRLSLKSSQHYAAPYNNLGEAFADIPRRLKREARMKLGLPASSDVAIISSMINQLHAKAEEAIGEPISGATISIPNLAALYSEDLKESFEYLNLSYIEFFPFYLDRPVRSTIAAYAGNGLGLCLNYTVPDLCTEQESEIPEEFLLAVSYTETSLTASQAYVHTAYHLNEHPTIEDLTLGYNARHNNSNEDFYWEKVRDVLSYPIVSSFYRWNITKLLVSGDASTNPKFRQILGEVTDKVIEGEVEVIDSDPIFSAARGSAELAKRAIFNQQNAINRDMGVDLDL